MSGNVYNPRPLSPSVQSNVTATRALDGTIYRNTSGRPMFVSIQLVSVTAGANYGGVSTGVNTPPTVGVAACYHDATLSALRATISFVVLPLYYYQFNQNTGTFTLGSWVEWT